MYKDAELETLLEDLYQIHVALRNDPTSNFALVKIFGNEEQRNCLPDINERVFCIADTLLMKNGITTAIRRRGNYRDHVIIFQHRHVLYWDQLGVVYYEIFKLKYWCEQSRKITSTATPDMAKLFYCMVMICHIL